MKKNIGPAMLILFFVACSPTSSLQTTASWINKDQLTSNSYNSIFIEVLTTKVGIKATIEDDLAAAAKARGLKVIKSIDVFPPNVIKSADVTKEMLINKIRALGCQVILTVALLDKKTESHYTSGSVAYVPLQYNYYNNFGSYYNYNYTYISSPGYYTHSNSYYLESNLFDANTEAILWSIQSTATNPKDIDKFSKDYTASIEMELEKKGILKK